MTGGSSVFKDFLDSPVPGPDLASKIIVFDVQCLLKDIFVFINGHVAPGRASRGMTAKGIIQRSYKMKSIVKPRLLRRGEFTFTEYLRFRLSFFTLSRRRRV